jgi:HD-like signal output (HDOD) protein
MSEAGIVTLLRQFEPFSNLGDDDLLILAGRTTIEHVPKGSVLFEHGDDDQWSFCLLDGTLGLEAADGRVHRVDAGTPRAMQPVSRLLPRQYTGRAVTPARVLRIDGSDLGDLTIDATQDHYLVEEMADQDEEHSQAAAILATELGERALELPSLPSVAIDTARLIDRDEADVLTVARVVMHDPVISAKLIRAANSPLFYGREAVKTCERAVLRLGLRSTRQLVVAFSLRDLFRTDARILDQRMRSLWLHSTEVGAIAFVLARHLGGFDPDEAHLAGLVHDIGVVPVLRYAAGRDELRGNAQTLGYLEAELKAEIGERLLRSWNFPEPLVVAARDAEQWWRDDRTEAELADLVVVAQLIALLGKPGRAQVPSMVRLPAFQKVSRGRLDPAATIALVDQAREQIAEVQAILA